MATKDVTDLDVVRAAASSGRALDSLKGATGQHWTEAALSPVVFWCRFCRVTLEPFVHA